MFGDRNFCIKDKEGNMVAYAHSLWVYMDMKKGRPVKPSEDEVELYGTGEPLEMEVLPRKIPLPEQMEELESFFHVHIHQERMYICDHIPLFVFDTEITVSKHAFKSRCPCMYTDLLRNLWVAHNFYLPCRQHPCSLMLFEIDYRYQCVITTERSYVANAKEK